ncbi:MAG: hypothetical protein KDC00_13775 [Flavobacteriales bacterium]|nr:hypothetical protein [Flavobacteriales bacterium]
MYRIRIFILSLIHVSFVNAFAQGQLKGVVLSGASGTGLEGVHVRIVGTEAMAISQGNGKFVLEVGGVAQVELELTHIAHVPLRRKVHANVWRGGTEVVLTMEKAAIELPLVTISEPAPEVVYARTDLHVGDYHVNSVGLWVLTYERPQLWHSEGEAGRRVFREARLHLLDTAFVERCSVRVPGEVVGLRSDHQQRTLVEGVERAWFAELLDGGLHLSGIDLEMLRSAVLPWTDSIAGRMLGSTYSTTYPAFDHIAYHTISEETEAICAVEDKRLMELFRSQYKYMSGRDKVIAMDLEIETGIDREIIAGYMTEFHRDPYFDAPYAPLFVVNDTLCVFDHFKERVRRFTKELRPIDEVPITYHQDRDWRSCLLLDQATGAVYAVFARGVKAWLRRVDTSTGDLGPVQAMTFRFPEDIQVHDGYIYYVYRPFGSLQRRTLYREPM